MNYSVPAFEVDDGEGYSIPTSSHLTRRIKSPKAGEDDSNMMELLWENGQIVLQNQRSKPRSRFEAVEIRPEEETPAATQNDLFMEEDEMTDWLHYPIDDSSFAHDLISDLGYPAPTVTEIPPAPAPAASTPVVREPAPSAAAAVSGSSRPPVHPPRLEPSPRFQNFALFSRHRGRAEPVGQGSSYNNSGREFTVADSNDTPARTIGVDFSGGAAAAEAAGRGKEIEIGRCEATSSGLLRGSGAGASACAEPMQKPAIEDRKRKGREADDSNCQSEHDVDFDCPDLKRQSSGSIPVRKSRAAEVHNLSERKRRDRINEKMKALQELIPHSNKADKASMLDEAIEYLKSLQLQVQMMSMGCSMVPMMFPGVQQYMTPVAAMGMGMGMGMDMAMARPMISYTSASVMPPTASAAHFGPRFPIPGYHMPPFPFPDPSRMQQQTAMPDPVLNPLNAQNSQQQQMPNFADPYQQYLGFQQMQMPFPQNQSAMHPSSSADATNHENLQSG